MSRLDLSIQWSLLFITSGQVLTVGQFDGTQTPELGTPKAFLPTICIASSGSMRSEPSGRKFPC